jgi:hypothetical protein
MVSLTINDLLLRVIGAMMENGDAKKCRVDVHAGE